MVEVCQACPPSIPARRYPLPEREWGTDSLSRGYKHRAAARQNFEADSENSWKSPARARSCLHFPKMRGAVESARQMQDRPAESMWLDCICSRMMAHGRDTRRSIGRLCHRVPAVHIGFAGSSGRGPVCRNAAHFACVEATPCPEPGESFGPNFEMSGPNIAHAWLHHPSDLRCPDMSAQSINRSRHRDNYSVEDRRTRRAKSQDGLSMPIPPQKGRRTMVSRCR